MPCHHSTSHNLCKLAVSCGRTTLTLTLTCGTPAGEDRSPTWEDNPTSELGGSGKIQLIAFCLFECMVGVFWPSMMTMRAHYIPEVGPKSSPQMHILHSLW